MHEWILLKKSEQLKLTKGKSIIRDVLAPNWEIVKYKRAPGLSPISSFYFNLLCTTIKRHSSFEVWKKAASWRFMDCVREHNPFLFLNALLGSIHNRGGGGRSVFVNLEVA